MSRAAQSLSGALRDLKQQRTASYHSCNAMICRVAGRIETAIRDLENHGALRRDLAVVVYGGGTSPRVIVATRAQVASVLAPRLSKFYARIVTPPEDPSHVTIVAWAEDGHAHVLARPLNSEGDLYG